MEVSSQIVVLNHGKIEQKGSPSEIYDQPRSDFVSRFIGQTNVFHLEKDDHSWLKSAGIILDDPKGIVVHVRPHNISVEKNASTAQPPFYLKDWQHLGGTIRLELDSDHAQQNARTIYAEMPNEQFKSLNLHIGERVALRFRHAHWFSQAAHRDQAQMASKDENT